SPSAGIPTAGVSTQNNTRVGTWPPSATAACKAGRSVKVYTPAIGHGPTAAQLLVSTWSSSSPAGRGGQVRWCRQAVAAGVRAASWLTGIGRRRKLATLMTGLPAGSVAVRAKAGPSGPLTGETFTCKVLLVVGLTRTPVKENGSRIWSGSWPGLFRVVTAQA